MIKSASNTGYVQQAPKNIGKTHNRKSELRAYRETIETANKNMIKAMEAGEYDAVDRWSRMIDATHAKILEIVNQEDGHSYKQIDAYGRIAKTTLQTVDGFVNLAGNTTRPLNIVV